jgi:hypothetical protein
MIGQVLDFMKTASSCGYAHHCKISDGQAGICMGRVNERKALLELRPDGLRRHRPVEKSPSTILSGSVILSVEGERCNFRSVL